MRIAMPTNANPAGQVVIAAVAVCALYFGRQVLMPIALASLLSFVLTPPLTRLERLGLGRALSVAAVTLVSFIFLAGVGVVIGNQASQLVSDLPKYQTGLQNKVKLLRETAENGALLRSLSTVMQGLGGQMNDSAQAPRATTTGDAPSAKPGAAPPPEMSVTLRQPPPTPYELASQFLGPVIEPIFTAGVILVFVIFILLEREDLRDRLIWLVGARDIRRTTNALDDAGDRLSRYFLAQTAINATFGLLLGIGLWAIGIPNFALWGSLAMLLRFLPYIGALLSAAIPLLLAAAIDPGWTTLFWTAGLFGALELVASQAVEPLLFGRTTGMSPLAVIMAAAFWTALWGPVGLLLSTPLTLLLVVFGQHVERFKVFAALLGESPPLRPEQSFYHKMIAGRSGEATEQAFAALKDHTLTAYYDEFALPGLRLLQADLDEGALAPGKLGPIVAGIDEVIDALDDYEDPRDALEAAPLEEESDKDETPPARVVCISGRSPFDRCVADMLKQILAKQGIGIRVAEKLPAATSARAESREVALVCLSYLSVDEGAGHATILIRRLRRRIPGAKILLGFWAHEEDDADDRERDTLKNGAGADLIATSLEEAVAICMREAEAAPRAASAKRIESERPEVA